jgi:hypothetical protein
MLTANNIDLKKLNFQFPIIEYVNIIVLLWNYPPILDWALSHFIYFISTCIYAVTRAYFLENITDFMSGENIREKYRKLLISHIYRTIGASIYSYSGMFSVYNLQKETSYVLLVASVFFHYIFNYFYYFELLKNNYIFFKNIPHMIDGIIVIGCIPNHPVLQVSLCIIHVGRLIMNDTDISLNLFLWTETYLISSIFTKVF